MKLSAVNLNDECQAIVQGAVNAPCFPKLRPGLDQLNDREAESCQP